MVKFDEKSLSEILVKKLREIQEYKEIISLVKENSEGNIYIIGGAVSRTLARELYGGSQETNDFDFVVDKLNEKITASEGWEVSYQKFGNPTFKKGNVEVDIFPISEHEYIAKKKLKPTIENMLEGVPFTIQALAFNIKNNELIGKEGIEALRNRKFKVNNIESAKNVSKRKGVTINERMQHKAETMDFGIIPFNENLTLNKVLNIRAMENNCTAAIIIRDGSVLLGNRVYQEKELSVWNFPGGRCDKGETIGEALKREVFEEIGIKSSDFKILDFIGEIKGSWKDDIVHLFYCSIDGEPILMEPEKFKEWKWVKIEEGLKTHFNDDAIKLVQKYINDNNILGV
ncbi:NUDIX domain-containing protein [Candidatus Pacearchaeota archaeon]|nr:NUDIX domain-containing protein [Candidatus Pacearchaeota archaeon]